MQSFRALHFLFLPACGRGSCPHEPPIGKINTNVNEK
jgi:hypothetical protein